MAKPKQKQTRRSSFTVFLSERDRREVEHNDTRMTALQQAADAFGFAADQCNAELNYADLPMGMRGRARKLVQTMRRFERDAQKHADSIERRTLQVMRAAERRMRKGKK